MIKKKTFQANVRKSTKKKKLGKVQKISFKGLK